MREAIYSERPKVPDFVYELIFEAEASKDAHEQVSHDDKSDLCCNSRANDCPDFKQFEIIAKDTAKAWTDMAMPDIWSFDSPEKRDEYAEALNTEIYEVLAVEILEDPSLAEYISGILKAQERANEDEEIELGLGCLVCLCFEPSAVMSVVRYWFGNALDSVEELQEGKFHFYFTVHMAL